MERYSCLDQIVCLRLSRFLSVKRALGGFVAPFRGVVLVVVWWAKVVTTPPNLDLVGAGPVGSHHGSYRCVRYRGGQIWGGTWGSARAASMVMATATSPRSHSDKKSTCLNVPNALILLRGPAPILQIVAALASAATPPWRMRATSPGHDHGTRPVAAHRRLPSGHPPTTFRLVEV